MHLLWISLRIPSFQFILMKPHTDVLIENLEHVPFFNIKLNFSSKTNMFVFRNFYSRVFVSFFFSFSLTFSSYSEDMYLFFQLTFFHLRFWHFAMYFALNLVYQFPLLLFNKTWSVFFS